MIDFPLLTGGRKGVEVFVNSKCIAYITPDKGFMLGSGLVVSAEELRRIADKVDEIKKLQEGSS